MSVNLLYSISLNIILLMVLVVLLNVSKLIWMWLPMSSCPPSFIRL